MLRDKSRQRGDAREKDAQTSRGVRPTCTVGEAQADRTDTVMEPLRFGEMSVIQGRRLKESEAEEQRVNSAVLSISRTFSKNIALQIQKLRVGTCYRVLDIVIYSFLFKVWKHWGFFTTSLFFIFQGDNATFLV